MIDDLNEGMPKSVDERSRRRIRTAGSNPLRPVDSSPEKSVESKIKKIGNNDPTKTPAGKMSVRRQGKKNKKNANKFKEAIDYVQLNQGNCVTESTNALLELDRPDLAMKLIRELAKSDIYKHQWWARQLRDGHGKRI